MRKSTRQCAAVVVLLCLAVLAVLALGASGVLSNESAIVGLTAMCLSFLAVIKWFGQFSSIYLVTLFIGSLGLLASVPASAMDTASSPRIDRPALCFATVTPSLRSVMLAAERSAL